MKLKHILIGSTIALTALCSCEDFLDVRPKQELVEGELFKSASGFEDAIYGVYGSLQTTALYGKNLTWLPNWKNGIPKKCNTMTSIKERCWACGLSSISTCCGSSRQ